MTLDFDVLEFCRKLRTSKQPPYTCPVVECSKAYKSMCGLQYHLVNFDHNGMSASNVTTPGPPVAKKIRKKGRGSHHVRGSHNVRTPVPSADTIIAPARESLTYAEAQKLVEFEINGRVARVNIQQPLKVVAKDEYEAVNGSINNSLCMSVHQGGLALTKSQEAVAKLPEPSFSVLTDYSISDAPPRPNSYIRFIERSAEEMDGEVEYDMDEEDAAWLVIINERRASMGVPEVPVDTFELLMDRLEKESYFQMQTNSKAGESATPSVIDDDAVCCICMDGECQNSNVILFCDMCNLAVHQDCYGVPYIPEGQWLCRRCLRSPSGAVDCVLCPNNGGAFKQTDRGHWAHVVCALWIPEVRFANTVFLEPIDSIETIPPARWKLTCYICKQRGVGACIQCHKTNCYSAFHVTCAQHAGLYMKMETVRDSHAVDAEPGHVLVQKTAYCDTHTPADAETRPRLPTLPIIVAPPTPVPLSPDDPHQNVKSARRMLAKKRTSVPVISIPTIPPDRIQEIGSLVSLAKKSQFIQRLIAYWTLKRQFRNGVPLLRRLQSSHLARRDEPRHSHQVGELYRQLKYWQCLRQDLERARLLCELVRKREKLKKELVKVKALCMEVELCPLASFLRRLMDLLRARDTGEIFIEPVDQSEVPDYGDVVTHPMDLSTMRAKVDDFQYSSLDEFEADFYLMIENCLAYNAKDTVFYRAALKMKEQGGTLLRQARKDMEIMGLDAGSGLLKGNKELGLPSSSSPTKGSTRNALADEANAGEIDKELAAVTDPANGMGKDEVLCKLLQLLDSSQNLKHGLARAKRVKMIKAEIVKLKRKMSNNVATPHKQASGGDKNYSTDTEAECSEEDPPKNKKFKSASGKETTNRRKVIDESSILTVKRHRRKKTWDDFIESPVSSKSHQSASAAAAPVMSTPEKDASVKNNQTPSKLSPGSDTQATVSPSGVNRRTAVLFTRKAAAATRQFKKPEAPPNPAPTSSTSTAVGGGRRRGRQPRKNLESLLTSEGSEVAVTSTTLPCTDSFRVYRSGGEIRGETDEESHSDEDSSCSVCSSTDGSSASGSGSGSGSGSASDWSDTEDESGISSGNPNSGQEALEQLQLVWAKCRGYPWYPALIINPKMPRGYIHNGVPIPAPPADVLALANNYSEPVYLVLFFDTKRTWQWLPRDKLEPLGVTPELDQIKLMESRKPTDRKAVRKAYQEAITHRTQVDKKEEPPTDVVNTNNE